MDYFSGKRIIRLGDKNRARCPVREDPMPHYGSPEEARNAYEELMKNASK